jgi:hypothetical protein
MPNGQDEATRKALQESNERREKSVAEAYEKLKGKPTPTQEENDRAALGEHVLNKEDDGSGPDPTAATRPAETRDARPAGERAGYRTRQETPRSE